jgi:hypothetical protein
MARLERFTRFLYLEFYQQVIGSQSPWIETILLNKGAKHITTFDYVKIKSDHPQVDTLTPDELAERYLNQNLRFDVMVTFSSLEHSGLGR